MAEHTAEKLHKEARSHCDSSPLRERAEKRRRILEPIKRGPGRPEKLLSIMQAFMTNTAAVG